jgi:hypothetical protein
MCTWASTLAASSPASIGQYIRLWSSVTLPEHPVLHRISPLLDAWFHLVKPGIRNAAVTKLYNVQKTCWTSRLCAEDFV